MDNQTQTKERNKMSSYLHNIQDCLGIKFCDVFEEHICDKYIAILDSNHPNTQQF